MDFNKIVSEVIKDKFESIETRICPDQFVGRISSFSATQTNFPIRSTTRDKNLKCLIMVIESPHIEEFKGEDTPCPANGKTGEQIRKRITEVKGLYKYKDYGLIIVNAIQHQCSLGFPTKYFRDAIFKKLWTTEAKGDFITRLQNIYRENDVIVNRCTKGNKNTKLRLMVQKSINNLKLDCTILRRTHPSSWFTGKNRNSEWSYTNSLNHRANL